MDMVSGLYYVNTIYFTLTNDIYKAGGKASNDTLSTTFTVAMACVSAE